MPVGDRHLATVVVDTTSMERAVAFWSARLGHQPREGTWDPDLMMLVDPAGRRLPVSLQRCDAVPDDAAPVHVDLYADEQQRHVDRLVALVVTRTATSSAASTTRRCDRSARRTGSGHDVRRVPGVGDGHVPGGVPDRVRRACGQHRRLSLDPPISDG